MTQQYSRGNPTETVARPAWAEHLLDLAAARKTSARPESRERFWVLLNLVLAQRLQLHSRTLGWIGTERIQDLASEKALDLVGKLDCGSWDPTESSPGELVSFVSTVARNALVDEYRRIGRQPVDSAGVDHLHAPAHRNADAPHLLVERKEFISHLIGCAERLKPPHRTVWLFRVLYEMPSQRIARHPEVRLKAGHVDMILSRCRNLIRRCMRSKGLDVQALPPGTFAELWKTFRLPSSIPEVAHD
jgi:DNA-directed RNA polymerase specialized sigma24 family protein